MAWGSKVNAEKGHQSVLRGVPERQGDKNNGKAGGLPQNVKTPFQTRRSDTIHSGGGKSFIRGAPPHPRKRQRLQDPIVVDHSFA